MDAAGGERRAFVPPLKGRGRRRIVAHFVPKKKPPVRSSSNAPEVVGKLNGETVKVASLADYRAALEKMALEPRTSTPGEFAAFLRAEYDKWGKVIGALKRQDTFSR